MSVFQINKHTTTQKHTSKRERNISFNIDGIQEAIEMVFIMVFIMGVQIINIQKKKNCHHILTRRKIKENHLKLFESTLHIRNIHLNICEYGLIKTWKAHIDYIIVKY